jgi:Domain of unknown function (DUF4386)
MTSPKRLARTAGLLYLIVSTCGGWAQLLVRANVIVPGDGAATANNVRASATLFRVACAADLVAFTCFLLVALVLYSLLRSINPAVAVTTLAINAVSVAILSLNVVNHGAALIKSRAQQERAKRGVCIFRWRYARRSKKNGNQT